MNESYSFYSFYSQLTVEHSLPTLHSGVISHLTRGERIQSLRFYDNGMTFIEPGTWNSSNFLTALAIENNNLTKINTETFENLRWLRVLRLDHNRISEIEDNAWQDTPRLEKLILSHNRLMYIEANIFTGLRFLRYLYLDHNSIYEMQSGAFGLTRMNVLDLRYNSLSTLEWNAFNSSLIIG